jgi:hypothetical protein
MPAWAYRPHSRSASTGPQRRHGQTVSTSTVLGTGTPGRIRAALSGRSTDRRAVPTGTRRNTHLFEYERSLIFVKEVLTHLRDSPAHGTATTLTWSGTPAGAAGSPAGVTQQSIGGKWNVTGSDARSDRVLLEAHPFALSLRTRETASCRTGRRDDPEFVLEHVCLRRETTGRRPDDAERTVPNRAGVAFKVDRGNGRELGGGPTRQRHE